MTNHPITPPPRDVAAVLDAIGRATGADWSTAVLTPLAGLSNRSVRLDTPHGRYVLRLAGRGTAAFVDRAAEAHNARLAARLGIGPEVVYADPRHGTLLTRYLTDSRVLDAAALRTSAVLRQVVGALQALHGSGATFRGTREIGAVVHHYTKVLDARQVERPPELAAALALARPAVAALRARPGHRVPCHGDPVPGNCLAQGDRVRLIDWEYSAQIEPTWDLACLAAEVDLGAAWDDALLRVWCGRPPGAAEAARFHIYKSLLDLVAALWALLRAVDEPAGRHRAYAEDRLRRCLRTARTPAYDRWLAAAAGRG